MNIAAACAHTCDENIGSHDSESVLTVLPNANGTGDRDLLILERVQDESNSCSEEFNHVKTECLHVR